MCMVVCARYARHTYDVCVASAGMGYGRLVAVEKKNNKLTLATSTGQIINHVIHGWRQDIK